jgi:hypothetical protein
MFVGATVVTGLIVALALVLGTAAFDFRRMADHSARLARLRNMQPTFEQVRAALAKEGAPLIASPRGREDLAAFLADRDKQQRANILAKAQGWPRAHVFQAGEMSYFLFFDEKDVLRDYYCLLTQADAK